MAKERMINTKFWVDGYISNLDPIEKLLYLYLLTNPSTNIAGIYEVPIKSIAVDTGIDKEMVLKIFKRFEKDQKIKYKDGWVVIKNFIKHQKDNPKVKKGIELIKEVSPVWAIDYLYSIHSLSHSNSNSNSNSNLNINTEIVSLSKKEELPRYGEFENVRLDTTELNKLIEKIGEKNTNLLIEELSGYLKSTGKRYSSHYATLLNWARRKVQTHTEKLETKKKWIA